MLEKIEKMIINKNNLKYVILFIFYFLVSLFFIWVVVYTVFLKPNNITIVNGLDIKEYRLSNNLTIKNIIINNSTKIYISKNIIIYDIYLIEFNNKTKLERVENRYYIEYIIKLNNNQNQNNETKFIYIE